MKESYAKVREYWTKEKVTEDALKYDSYHDWLTNSSSSYYYAKKNNWADEINIHFLKRGKEYANTKPRMTKEQIFEESKKYTRWTDLMKLSPNLYRAILHHNLKDQIKPTMLPGKIKKWTKETIITDAQKYTNVSEWKKNSPSAYRISSKLGCYKECSAHFQRLTKIITNEDVFTEALKYNRRVDFQNNSPSYYSKALINGWLDKCCSHMMSIEESKEQGRNYRWTEETIMKEVKKFKRWGDMLNANQGLRDALERLGILKNIKNQMDTSNKGAWTFEELKKISMKYKSLKTFSKHNEGALRCIYKNGWAKKLINHLRIRKKPQRWTHKKILKLIKECKTRDTLHKKDNGAYNFVKKHPHKYDHLFISNILEIELKMLHPKIKKIFNKNNKNFNYNEKFKIKNKSIFPDFTYRFDNTLYIIEAKTSGCHKSRGRIDTDTQVKEQIQFAKKLYPNQTIVHILISEEGLVIPNFTNHAMSLKELDHFLKYNKIIKMPRSNKLTHKELSVKIRKQFIKNQKFSSGILHEPRLLNETEPT